MMEQKKFFIKSHLWIKIYGIVFMTVIILMLIFVRIWQHQNIRYLFSREEEDIIRNQSYLSNALADAVSFAALSDGVEKLSADKFKIAVESAFYYNMGEIALFQSGSLVVSTYRERDNIDKKLAMQDFKDKECHLEYYDREDSHYIKAISAIELQNQTYMLITTTDIADLYDYQNRLMRQAAVICMVGGMIAAVFLLLIFRIAFKPLKDINENVKTIAAGNYDNRIEVRRNDELGELADNVNGMAQAVGDNIRSLKELTSEQKRFIDNLTHEMKTPLTSIICFAEIILTDANLTREKMARHAGIIAKEGKRLSVISHKLMDFIHIGKINECDKMEVSMGVLVNDVCSMMAPMLAKKQIYLRKHIEDFKLKVDWELFKTMLSNYLDNAMKASRENDTIEIAVYQENGDKIIRITDHGIGIPEDEIDKIEEPFYMVDKSRSRKAGGAGLGMALCKKIVTAHGGEVGITSKLGEGTEIKIIFKDQGDRK